MLTAFLCLAGLASANGANDVSRTASTLVGGGVSRYRPAMLWAAGWTLAGSLLSGWLAAGVARKFATALGTDPNHLTIAVPAVLLGAIVWIALSTYRRLPVATTHALVGALLGVTWLAGGWAACHRINLARGFFIPLIASPIISGGLAVLVRRLLPRALDAYPKALDRAHWVSAGLTALSRGINDSAKIWAILIPLATVMSIETSLFAHATQITVALAMLAGSLVAGRRVTENLAFGVLPMSSKDSVVANVSTATVIISASLLAFPVASSHVVSGAILGVGLAGNRRSLHWRTIADIAMAWVLTLPAAAILAMSVYVGLRRAREVSFPETYVYGLAILTVVAFSSVWLIRSRRSRFAAPASAANASLSNRLIVFVCNSNTSRSPMAAQICHSMLARMRGALSSDLLARITVVSRGISAVDGDPMAPFATDALRRIHVAPQPHAASNLTEDTMQQAMLIFCMTDAQVIQVRERFPSFAAKVIRLHPEIDIPNPAGKALIDFESVASLLTGAIGGRMSLIAA